MTRGIHDLGGRPSGEFGTRLPDDVEIRMLDSTADMRCIVLPLRPAGTERMSEGELVTLITRDSMTGVSVLTPPRR